MTFHPHPMTRHDVPTADEYADEVLRAEQQGGLTITAKHFHVLAGLLHTEREKRNEHDRAASRLSQAGRGVVPEDGPSGR